MGLSSWIQRFAAKRKRLNLARSYKRGPLIFEKVDIGVYKARDLDELLILEQEEDWLEAPEWSLWLEGELLSEFDMLPEKWIRRGFNR